MWFGKVRNKSMVLAYTCMLVSLGSRLDGIVVPDCTLGISPIPVESSIACKACLTVVLPRGPPAPSSFPLSSILSRDDLLYFVF